MAASIAALILLGGGGVYWLNRSDAAPAPPIAAITGQTASSDQPAATSPALSAPTPVAEVPPQPPAPSPPADLKPAVETEFAQAEPAAPAAEAPPEDEPAPIDAEDALAVAEPGAEAPQPEPDQIAPPVINILSDPPGAEVRRKGKPQILGTTPFNWTPPEADLKSLSAGRPLTLVFAGPGGESGKATLTGATLSADLPELSATLKAPKRRASAPSKPASKPSTSTPRAKSTNFHF